MTVAMTIAMMKIKKAQWQSFFLSLFPSLPSLLLRLLLLLLDHVPIGLLVLSSISPTQLEALVGQSPATNRRGRSSSADAEDDDADNDDGEDHPKT